MTGPRQFHAGDDAVSFDWRRPARELDVPIELARELHARAMRRGSDPEQAATLYLGALSDTASARRRELAPPPVPGKQTRVLDEADDRDRSRGRPQPHPVPGRSTQVMLAYHGDAELGAGSSLPGLDDVQRAMRARVAPPRDPTSADPPATGQPGGEVLRALGRSASGTRLPDDVAARLRPHVGGEAVATARVHTDAAADQVAAGHRARAVAFGRDIYFARGEYAPGTARGDALLVHELTHVAQAERGDLFHAAAKGIDDGGALDPAEAEAELRARLAVIELHPPATPAPPLATPTGQPTSDGDRAARIAAQQQRLALADPPMAADPGGGVPAAAVPRAPVPHPPPAMAAPPAPASTGNAYVEALAAPPSKQALDLWATAGTQATTRVAADQARFDAGLPAMPVVLDGGEARTTRSGAAGVRAPAAPPPVGAAPPAATPSLTPTTPPAVAGATAVQAVQPVADKAQMKADGQKAIDAIPTTMPDVKTDPGPAPVTDLAGQSDPVRAIADQQHIATEGARALDDARTRIVTGPGAAAVQPVKLDEKLNVPRAQPTGAMPQLPSVDGMARLKQWNLPGNALAAFDTVARPRMDAGLAQARAQMTQADTRRDADRDKAVTGAQDKVKAAHADADHQQQAKVADARTQIANHQADALVKHEAEAKKLEAQSGDRKKTALGKIHDRIAADQTRVESDYQAAQNKAEDKKQQGEADAQQKKQAAQNKKDESWWDQAADAICDGIKAIADEIDKALDAVCKAIGQILDEVKDAACKVIDAARDFACQALTEFGDWLKSQIDALIGSVFPELAAALDQLIDGAVSLARAAVNAIASGLKQAVSALCDALKASLDGIIAAFKAAVQAAATFAQAAVTGNWALVGKMILDGILNALGIDPAAFHALIGEAEDSIEKIIANPGAFVGHLIDAVKLGFKQFGANFWTHLKDGLVQWLFGTFAQAGITMPASFDIAGIFDLVCQVLGLTWPRLRGKVVKLIGEKNTERLEFVAQYVQALITGGFTGLWEKIQGDLSSLWDMVVGGIRDWLIQAVVMAAIEKIATMWNPAGAIFELIKTAWNVYQWVRENAQRIFGLVQAVVDSVSNIVAGNIGGAANFIEASLARLVPVAISLFADLLGLGGLADKIREIIEKVQDKIDHAIDALIERVMKLFQGKGGDDKHGDDGHHTVGEVITFEAAGHSHRMWFDVKGEQATLVVASDPLPVKDHLAQMDGQVEHLHPDQQTHATGLIAQARDADARATAAAQGARHGGGDPAAADSDEHVAAGLMQQLFELFEGVNHKTLQAACKTAGGLAEKKFEQVMAETQPGAVAARPAFLAGANLRLAKDPSGDPLKAMRDEVTQSGTRYILLGNPIPHDEIVEQGGISRVIELPEVYEKWLEPGYKARFASESAFLDACAAGEFDPNTQLDNSAELRGSRLAMTWWFATASANGVTLGQIKKQLTITDAKFDHGLLRLNASADDLVNASIALHKPTAFDGIVQGAGDDPLWKAAPGETWGLTADGTLEALVKSSQLGVFKHRELILPRRTDPLLEALMAEAGATRPRSELEARCHALATQFHAAVAISDPLATGISQVAFTEHAPPSGGSAETLHAQIVADQASDADLTARAGGNTAQTQVLQRGGPGHDMALVNTGGGSMAANPNFEADAAAFEDNFGRLAWNHPAADRGSAQMAAKARAYLEARAGEPWSAASKRLADMLVKLGSDNPGWSGAAGLAVENVIACFEDGNIAERMNHVGEFFIKILGQDLVDQDISKLEGWMTKAQLDVDELLQRRAEMDAKRTPSSAPTRFDIAPVPDGSAAQDQWHARADRIAALNITDPAQAYQATHSTRMLADTGADMTDREIEVHRGKQSDWNKDVHTVKWEEGTRKWIMNERDKWIQWQRQLSLPLGAGPSGTTNQLMQAARALACELYDARAACIAYLLPAHHHTLVEILAAAAPFGCAYTPGQKMYHQIDPFKTDELRSCGKAGKFPDETQGDDRAAHGPAKLVLQRGPGGGAP